MWIIGSSIDRREAEAAEDFQDAIDKRTDLVGTLTGAQVGDGIKERKKAQGEFGRKLACI